MSLLWQVMGSFVVVSYSCLWIGFRFCRFMYQNPDEFFTHFQGKSHLAGGEISFRYPLAMLMLGLAWFGYVIRAGLPELTGGEWIYLVISCVLMLQLWGMFTGYCLQSLLLFYRDRKKRRDESVD